MTKQAKAKKPIKKKPPKPSSVPAKSRADVQEAASFAVLEQIERLPGETDKQYAALQKYLALPPQDRSILRAYRVSTGKDTAKAPPSSWREWSKTYKWAERAAAFDQVHAEHRSAVSLLQLERYYESEDGYGELLCDMGGAFVNAVATEINRHKENNEAYLGVALPLLESRSMKTAMDAIKVGCDLRQRAAERKAQIVTALAEQHDIQPMELTQEQTELVKAMWEVLTEKARGGDLVAIETVLNRVGVVPLLSQ